jgi:hypothetical protein
LSYIEGSIAELWAAVWELREGLQEATAGSTLA